MMSEDSSAAGTDNRPPMLEENDYESWKIRIERYIKGKTHGKLIWKSIINGPSPHPQITDPVPDNSPAGTVMQPRNKTDEEFDAADTLKEQCDIQASNILSQGLPRRIFNTLNQNESAKEIWDSLALIMKGAGQTIDRRKEDLFDEYERFRAKGNEPIYDYFVRFHKLINDMKVTKLVIPTHQMNTKFVNNLPSYWSKYVTNVKNAKDMSTVSYVDLFTHLRSYEEHAMKTLRKQEQSSSVADPLAYLAKTTLQLVPTHSTTNSPSQLTPVLASTSSSPAQSHDAAMLATMQQIANLLSGFQKQFPPTNNQLRSSSNTRSQATVHDGQITTETVQRRAPGNVGNTGSRGNQNNGQGVNNQRKVICYNCREEGHVARQCKEPKRPKDSLWHQDKAMLLQAKEKGAVLDAEAEAFLADVECTVPLAEPLALSTTNMFQVSHEDAYDSDVDDEPNAAAAFMANLSSSSSQINKVRTFNDTIFETVSHSLSPKVPHDEHLDSDDDEVLEDYTIPYDQYLATKDSQDVPTEASPDPPSAIPPSAAYMLNTLSELTTQVEGHRKVNQKQALVNATLTAELDRCKLELARLEHNKVKLENDQVILARNKQNAELKQETESLKTTLRNKEATIAHLTCETKTVLSEKKTLEDKYLEEIVCLKSANQVATGLLQKFQMPTQTIPMLSKKPMIASSDIHKIGLGFSNPWYGRKAQLSQPALYDGHRLLQPGHARVTVHDSDETLLETEVSRMKMSQKPGHVKPIDYAKLNALDPPKPVTPFVCTSPEKSQVQDQLWYLKAEFSKFDEIIKERTSPRTNYLQGSYEFCYLKKCFDEAIIPFYNNIKQGFQNLHTNLCNEVTEFKRTFDELDTEYEHNLLEKKNLKIEKKNLIIVNECLISDSIAKNICSIVLAFVKVVPPISDCMCVELRSSCDREHNRVLELEAEILKKQQMINDLEQRSAFIQNDHVKLQVKFQNYKEAIQNQKLCDNSNSIASNAIFEINKLKDQLQGRDETIRNLHAQINIISMLNVGSPVGSFDKNALETEISQLKDNISSLRIQNDGYKIEIAKQNRRYLELSKASTHSRNTSTKKLVALHDEIAKMKPSGCDTKVSGPETPEKPKVLVPGMYVIRSKYIPPPKRADWIPPTPRKKHVTFQEPTRASTRHTKQTAVNNHKKPNVNVIVSTGMKPAAGVSKTQSKSDNQKSRVLPSKNVSARRIEDHPRNLNKKKNVNSSLYVKRFGYVSNKNAVCGACDKCLVSFNHDSCLVINVPSMNTMHAKKPQVARPKTTPKYIRKTDITVAPRIVPQWKPTGRQFLLCDIYGPKKSLTPIAKPLELSPSVSSSSPTTVISRFSDCQLSDRKASSKGISDLFA
ncbi:putative reverse transcriptase domain, ribonuclease H-like domain, aspartic peptidase domain protein [Tanacetum coccineum]